MATDAHAFLQYRERDQEQWYLLAMDVQIDQDYLLFACLARVRLDRFPDTVRRDIAAFCPAPKGLPEDWVATLEEVDLANPHAGDHLTRWVKGWYPTEGTPADGHSFTWLTYRELCRAGQVYFLAMTAPHEDAELVQAPKPLVNVDLEGILRYAGTYVGRGCSVRLVVWFDN